MITEELKKFEKTFTALVSSNFTILSDRLTVIEKIIGKNEERIEKIEKNICELNTSVSFQGDVFDKKIKDTEDKHKKFVNEIKEKLREIEDRSRRNNLRIDGMKENAYESWEDCERKVKQLFGETLQVKDVMIERAHRSGKVAKGEKPRTIVLKLLNYKDKEKILKQAKKLKGTDVFINEDYSRETVEIRKRLWQEVKARRQKGERVMIRYDKIIKMKDERPKNSNGYNKN